MPTTNKKKTKRQFYYSNPKKLSNRTNLMEMPASFARELIKQITNNPKNSSSKKNYTYSLYSCLPP